MCNVLQACPRSISDIPSRSLWQQLVRAAMGASGNLEEADEASSTADFLSKMKIALREAREARLWLRAMDRCKLSGHDRVNGLVQEAGELAAIFARIVLNVKLRVEEEKKRTRK